MDSSKKLSLKNKEALESNIKEKLLIDENNALKLKIKHKLKVDTLIKDGASEQEAKDIIEISNEYDIKYTILGSLCWSESRYDQFCTHAVPYVVGAFGISLKDGDLLPANPHTFKGNAKCSAARLKRNLNHYKGNYRKAITAYKGICDLGRRQADVVLRHSTKL